MLSAIFKQRRARRRPTAPASQAPEVETNSPEAAAKRRRSSRKKFKSESTSQASAIQLASQEPEVPWGRKRPEPEGRPSDAAPPAKEPRSKTSGAARRREAKAKAARQTAEASEEGSAKSLEKIEVARAVTSEAAADDQAIALPSIAASMPEAGPAPLSQAELAEVRVTGSGAGSTEFKPWMTFEDVRKGGPRGKLPQAVVDFMGRFKAFKEPTAIQAHCWPAACARRNVVGISKTGSGKTLAYICPSLSRILEFKKSRNVSFGPYSVVLAPTRELATQIAKDAKGLCQALRIALVCIYGGAAKGEQVKALDKGADMIVATPGRLDEFASKPDKFTGRTIISLSMVHYLVLDESDCMLDLGFEPQVRKILRNIADDPQILCFSATWPKKVQALAEEFAKDALYIRVGSSESVGVAGNRDVEQRVVIVAADDAGEADRGKKKEELWRLLWKEHHGETSLVFCTTKKVAAVLSHQLKEDGFSARGLHGDMAQVDRDEAMRAFKSGEVQILVATDVAARGLDVKGITLVINYDPAVQLDDHIHRIGRTSRAGHKGVAYTLLGSEDVRQAKFVAESLRSAGHAVPQDVAELAGRKTENSKTRKLANMRAKKKAKRKEAALAE